jgi:hypothetical protein
VAVIRWCVLMACAVGAVAVLAAGLPAAPKAPAPAWRIFLAIHTANTILADVAATGRDSAWAAGVSGASTPVVYRWNGYRWRAVPRPGRPGSSAASVTASSAANVWVTIANEAAVDHWNGHAWSRFSFGSPARTEIDGVTTTGRKDVWAFAYDKATNIQTAFHYDGRGWKGTRLAVPLAGGSTARLVSSSSRSDVWAWAYDAGHSHRGWVALHFNGSAWRVLPLPAGLLPARRTILPEQMLAESPTSVWGTVYAASGSSRGPVILVHWNGRVWRRVTGRLPAGSLTGPIAPDGQGGLWLCGEGPGGAGFLAHYRGGQWTQGPAPAAALSVTALTLIPGTATLWGAGTTGEGFGTSKGAVILRYGR